MNKSVQFLKVLFYNSIEYYFLLKLIYLATCISVNRFKVISIIKMKEAGLDKHETSSLWWTWSKRIHTQIWINFRFSLDDVDSVNWPNIMIFLRGHIMA